MCISWKSNWFLNSLFSLWLTYRYISIAGQVEQSQNGEGLHDRLWKVPAMEKLQRSGPQGPFPLRTQIRHHAPFPLLWVSAWRSQSSKDRIERVRPWAQMIMWPAPPEPHGVRERGQTETSDARHELDTVKAKNWTSPRSKKARSKEPQANTRLIHFLDDHGIVPGILPTKGKWFICFVLSIAGHKDWRAEVMWKS